MNITPPVRKVAPPETCLWLEEARTYQPKVCSAVVLETSGDQLRVLVIARDGSLTVKSNVLPFGDPRLKAEDGTISAVGRNNGCWFLPEQEAVDAHAEEIESLRKEITTLKARVTKLSK